jgi:tyrosine-protein kinase
MELRDYLRIIRKRLILIIVATIACAAAALGTSLASTPIYQGTTKLLVVAKTERDGGISSAYQGALLSQQLVESFAQILESRGTAEQALRLDPLPITPRQLREKVKAEPVPETLLINLQVEDPDPARAKRLANSVTRAFIQSVPRLQGGSTLRVSLVEPALQPTEPVRPKTRLNTAFGLTLGLMLGIGLAFLREFLDRSLKTAEELEAAAGVPVVGMIPPFKAARQPIPVAQQPRTPAAEAFRKLRTNFGFLGVDRENVCCVVTSPASGDGKSTVAANLAIALAQTGQRVVVIDADLRKPSLHKLFDLPQRVGTTTVLLDDAHIEDALQHPGPSLPAVLTAGQLPPNPSEVLGSRRMADLLAWLRARYNVVLIDCAPLLPVTDPMVVSQFADGVLLVTRSGRTTRDEAAAVRAVCGKAGAAIFGTVLNATPVTEGDQPSQYAYYGEVGRASKGKVEPGRDRPVANRNGNGSRVADKGRTTRHRRVRFGSRR